MNRDTLSEIIGVEVHTSLRKLTNSREAMQAWTAIKDMPEAEWDNVCYAVADDIIHYIAGSTQLAEDLKKSLEQTNSNGR